MVDSVVDIPLPGRPLESGEGDGRAVAPCHFFAGPENRLVDVAIRCVLEEPETGYNPLVLYGPSGTGKSHVAQGLAAAWKAQHRRDRVVVTTAVDFARELAEAIESQSVEEFREKYRKAQLLIFEDLGQLVTRTLGKLSAQEEFVHTLDTLLAEQRWVIVTASAAPAELPGLTPALQSRLTAGLSVALSPPSQPARLAILRQLAALQDVQLPETVVQTLAEGITGTVPELAGAFVQFLMTDQLEDCPINVQGAKRYLAEQNHKQQPSMHEIAVATARYFSLRLTDLRSPVRRRALVAARGVAVYLAHRHAGVSFEEIGRYFGGRDHTTVLHSCRKTEESFENDPAIHESIEKLRKELWKK